MPTLLYLHGFLSSPRSQKAQQTLAYCRQLGLGERVIVPELTRGPAETMAELRLLIDARSDAAWMLMGSSLGGFYATALAEHYDLPAVLINPAVRPYEFWQTHLGKHRNYYTDEVHEVTEQHIGQLRDLEKSPLARPENFLVFLQTADETLDYRQALDKYSSKHCIVREGGSHSYDNYSAELPAIFDFLLSRSTRSVR